MPHQYYVVSKWDLRLSRSFNGEGLVPLTQCNWDAVSLFWFTWWGCISPYVSWSLHCADFTLPTYMSLSCPPSWFLILPLMVQECGFPHSIITACLSLKDLPYHSFPPFPPLPPLPIQTTKQTHHSTKYTGLKSHFDPPSGCFIF